MIEKDLYDYLQPLMPELQWCNPYINDYPLPTDGRDFATFTLINLSPIGWNIPKTKEYDEETGLVTVGYTQQKVYTVQLDFYGKNALDNANTFRQYLTMNLQRPGMTTGLKSVSPLRNLTSLITNKKWERRYEFEIELFIVDEVVTTQPIIETATIKIVNRGNNNN